MYQTIISPDSIVQTLHNLPAYGAIEIQIVFGEVTYINSPVVFSMLFAVPVDNHFIG